ncbi:hypothetical protein C8F01DRAFT_1167778 [Mycena amicta]|nr:hypothetical protein C8F01DRAFT_1188499 [Mycena amicta]KAJ7053197.1 hypothetical protein C8F01DRAFT_1167778 [Mycena amicta]
MRFSFALIALFALPALATATENPSSNHEYGPARSFAAALLRPWTWPLHLGGPAVPEPNAVSEHVRRHGPRRRGAAHP